MEPRTRLYLDDVKTPVRATVARRGDNEMLLAQDLPFLKLKSSVRDADGRRAELASVYLAVHGDTPRLMLELRYPDETPALATAALRSQRRDHTMPYLPLGESTRPARRDATVPYQLENAAAVEDVARMSTLPGVETLDTADEDATIVFRREEAVRETLPAGALVLARAGEPRRIALRAFVLNAWRALFARVVRAVAMVY